MDSQQPEPTSSAKLSSFNGATSSQKWIVVPTHSAPLFKLDSFNGATSSQKWIAVHESVSFMESVVSMGPLLLRNG